MIARAYDRKSGGKEAVHRSPSNPARHYINTTSCIRVRVICRKYVRICRRIVSDNGSLPVIRHYRDINDYKFAGPLDTITYF